MQIEEPQESHNLRYLHRNLKHSRRWSLVIWKKWTQSSIFSRRHRKLKYWMLRTKTSIRSKIVTILFKPRSVSSTHMSVQFLLMPCSTPKVRDLISTMLSSHIAHPHFHTKSSHNYSNSDERLQAISTNKQMTTWSYSAAHQRERHPLSMTSWTQMQVNLICRTEAQKTLFSDRRWKPSPGLCDAHNSSLQVRKKPWFRRIERVSSQLTTRLRSLATIRARGLAA